MTPQVWNEGFTLDDVRNDIQKAVNESDASVDAKAVLTAAIERSYEVFGPSDFIRPWSLYETWWDDEIRGVRLNLLYLAFSTRFRPAFDPVWRECFRWVNQRQNTFRR